MPQLDAANLTLNLAQSYDMIELLKGGISMPNIQPISELRNYSSLLETVTPGVPVYLTKNGHGAYAIVHIEDQEETEKMKAALRYMCEMNKGIRAGEEEGWLSIEQVRAHMKERHHAVQG